MRARVWMLAAVAAIEAPSALAQIYKCVDPGGATTYQQTPCPAHAKGGRLEISTDNGTGRDADDAEAAWEDAAKQKNVSVGMPRRFVRLALGAPRDMRAGRAEENASEVWSYARADGAMQRIGFRNGAVVWLRDDLAAEDGGPAPDDEATQRMLRRRNVAPGSECTLVIASLGGPDQTDTGAAASLDDPNAIIRYIWEPAPGDPNTRTTVTCAGGRVTMVDRNPVR